MRKALNWRVILRIILGLVVLITIISTVRHCANPYSTQTVIYYEYQKSISGEGYILRGETIVSNDISGVFEPYVNEGERVGKDSKVGTIISGEPDEAMIMELGEINQRIEDIEKSATIAGIYQSDAVRITNAVSADVENIREAVQNGDLASATELKREIGYLKDRTSQLESSESTELLLLELYERKDQIETAIGTAQKEVFAPISGVYSRSVDGLEKYGGMLTELTPKDVEGFDGIIKDYEQNPRDICKITDNFAWHLVAEVKEDEAAGITPGAGVAIRIDNANSAEVNGTVYYISEAQDGKQVIVFSSDLYVEGISSLRSVDYEVVLRRKSGLRIPSSALRIEDGKKGVYILIDKKKSFRYVNDDPFRSEDDQYYIVDAKYTPAGSSADYVPLKEYDKVLINPEEVR